MSPSASAPKMASVIVCIATSASECPIIAAVVRDFNPVQNHMITIAQGVHVISVANAYIHMSLRSGGAASLQNHWRGLSLYSVQTRQDRRHRDSRISRDRDIVVGGLRRLRMRIPYQRGAKRLRGLPAATTCPAGRACDANAGINLPQCIRHWDRQETRIGSALPPQSRDPRRLGVRVVAHRHGSKQNHYRSAEMPFKTLSERVSPPKTGD